jgi:hypothetical protein
MPKKLAVQGGRSNKRPSGRLGAETLPVFQQIISAHFISDGGGAQTTRPFEKSGSDGAAYICDSQLYLASLNRYVNEDTVD